MADRTVTAMFANRIDAERAEKMLANELHLDRSTIRTSPGEGVSDTGYDKSRSYEEKGFFSSLKDLFVPDEDRYAYAEGMRRGNVLLTAHVPEAHVERASDILEHGGAMDLDTQETAWRREGWTGYDAAAHTTARGVMANSTMSSGTAEAARADTQDDVIRVAEERLVVGKRVVEGGRVRVRAYIVERPVEEQVTLRDETVRVERHAVDRAATPADMEAFKERTIEMTETDEEAVVSKEARIVEEIGLRKDVADRVETVRDTVRRTQVDVEDANSTGVGSVAGGTSGNPPGTKASRAVDKTLGTNLSGANPGRKP